MRYNHQDPNDELYSLFRSGRHLTYSKGKILQRATEIPRGIYFLEEGYVREYTLSGDGTEHLTIIYKPGELFSINWMFLSITPHVYRQAHTDTKVLVLSAAEFKNAINNDPRVHTAFTYHTMRHMHLLSSRVANLTLGAAYDRVAYYMIHLAGRFGESTSEGWYIQPPLKHQQVAEALNISRETASRMIAKIEKKGFVAQDGKGHFTIRDPYGLADTIGVEDVLGMWPKLAKKTG